MQIHISSNFTTHLQVTIDGKKNSCFQEVVKKLKMLCATRLFSNLLLSVDSDRSKKKKAEAQAWTFAAHVGLF